MKKKMWLSFSAIGLAVVAILLGFCFVFLGNKKIKEIPSIVSVEKIADKFYVVSDYNANTSYKFKIEHLLEDEFVTIGLFDSKTNMLSLDECDLTVLAGNTYRFSVCFSAENGVRNSVFSEALIWTPSYALNQVNYDLMVFDNDNHTLVWQEVYQADSYLVHVVDSEANVVVINTQTPRVELNELNGGYYDVYVVASSENKYIDSSTFGSGKKISVIKQNDIVLIDRSQNGTLEISCTQKVDAFEVLVNGKTKAVVYVDEFEKKDDLYSYHFENANIIFANVDFSNDIVMVKSLGIDCVLESDLVSLI